MIAAAIAVYQLAFFAAVDRTGVAVGTVVALGSAPALAGVAGRLLDGEPLTRRWAPPRRSPAPACCCSCSGAAALPSTRSGSCWRWSPAPGYATYTILAKRLLRLGHAPERVMAASFSLGAVLLAARARARRPPGSRSGDGLAMAVFLGAIPTALAYVLFARGLRHLTPGETATLTLAEPLTATGLGILALGERPGAVAAVGAALVLAGLLALALPARGAPAPASVAGMTARLALQRVSTVDAIAAALRTRILDGELAAGERLRELELADAYGVARHSLRAALRALAAEGLVAIEPNRGASVAGSRRPTSARCSSCAPRWSSRPRGSRSSATAGGCPSRSTTRCG